MISKQNSFAFDEGHPLPKPFNVEDNEGWRNFKYK